MDGENKLINVIDHYDDHDITIGSLGNEKLNIYYVNLFHEDPFKRCTCPANIFKHKNGECKHEEEARKYLSLLKCGGERKPAFPMVVYEVHGDEFIVKSLTTEGICFYVVRPSHPDPRQRCECSRTQFGGDRCRHQKEVERYLHLLNNKKIGAVPTFPKKVFYC